MGQKLCAIEPWIPGEADFNAADAALAHAKPLTAKEVQILLGANEALVFFLVGANESYVFALTREGFEWRTISLGEKNVSAKVAAFRRGLDVVELTKSVSMGKAQRFDLAAAHELYVALFGSVEALIKDKSQTGRPSTASGMLTRFSRAAARPICPSRFRPDSS
jgi:hypothetical protein